jgi:hypothetical protein
LGRYEEPCPYERTDTDPVWQLKSGQTAGLQRKHGINISQGESWPK